ncbi:MAG: PQQ-binding-like beta-propeller repeat protein [Phycisphaerales bacterium JB059]
MSRGRIIGLGLGLLGALGPGVSHATAQPENPVYADDSPLAADTLGRLDDLLSIESYAEAARALQRLLEDEGQRVLRSPGDDRLFLPVRDLVHERLLANPELLERYREAEGPRAAALLAAGDEDEAERTRLLTPAGFEAALRIAQRRLEEAKFHAALRTLAQLEAHPDRTGERSLEAARLMVLASRYVDNDRWRDIARAWAERAGIERVDLSRIEAPEGARVETRQALDPGTRGAPIEVDALSTTPLRSEPLSPVSPTTLDAPRPLTDQPASARTRPRTYAWSMPAAVGDVLYVSDGVTVSAWDRYTLGELWRRRIGPPPGQGDRDRFVEATRQRLGQNLEDSASVTVAGDALLATSGFARSGSRTDGGSVHCLDRATGRERWRVDIAQLDESLEGASVRGPLLVDGRTVVVTARKAIRSRRLVGQSFVGLDLRTGAHKWTRPVASAGSLPFQTFGYLGEAGVVHEGVAFRSDAIGVVGAVEAETGRPVWTRLFSPSALYTNSTRSPWGTPVPLIDGDSIILISPDREEVLRLDARTGAVLARRPSDAFARPQYLLRAGGTLVLVGEDRVAFVDIRRFDTDPVRLSQRIDPATVSGRATVSGDLVLLPTQDGVLTIDPARPREATRTPMELTGNLLALPGQLVAVGEFEAHSYLVWETASSLLRERMRLTPEDPAPSATFAELAFRSGREAEIAPALDQAIRAMRQSGGNDPLRRRLFNAVLAMVRPEEGAPGVSGLQVRRVLTDRLGALARDAEERVAHLMARGRLHESAGEAEEAIASYQRILGDTALSASTWRGSTLAVRAELEASRRIRDVVTAHGVRAYAGFDGEARVELDLLTPDHPPEGISAIARRYPASGVTPELWVRASEAYDREGRPHAAERALRAALASAETLHAAGASIPGEMLAEISGRLATALAVRARTSEALETLERARAIDPGVSPTVEGSPVDVSRLASLGRERHGWSAPVIGTRVEASDRPALISGAVLGNQTGAWVGERVLLFSPELGELTMRRATPEGLERLWTRETGVTPTLLEADARGALVHWASGRGGTIERLSIEDGSAAWTTAPLETLMEEMSDRAPGAPPMMHDRGEFLAPLDGAVSPRSMLHAIGEQTLVISDRAGRVVAIDTQSGRELWRRRTRLARVFDLDVGAGVVALGGEALRESGSVPMIVALDARTGEVISPIEGVSSQVRWVRVSATGDLIGGLSGAVVSMNVVEGRVNWVITGLATEESLGAFLFDDTIVIIDADRELWIGNAEEGRLNALELDTRGRVRPSGGVVAHALGDRVLIAGSGGVAIYERDGQISGIDAIDTPGDMLPPTLTRDAIVMVERTVSDGRLGAFLHLLDTDSARLLASYELAAYDTPTGVACVNGYVLVSVGGVTMVVPAPE